MTYSTDSNYSVTRNTVYTDLELILSGLLHVSMDDRARKWAVANI